MSYPSPSSRRLTVAELTSVLGGSTDPRADAGLVVTEAARRCVRYLTEVRATVATAESLTGGLVGAALTAVPGASAAYRGGVVPYATDLKHQLLGVDAALLARVGAVDPDVAAQLADGVRARLGADYGLSTTGVAGPDPQDGHAPGTVWTAVAGPGGVWVVDASSAQVGDRHSVRRESVMWGLLLLEVVLTRDVPDQQRG